jgi:AraC-like DNA-binding protein
MALGYCERHVERILGEAGYTWTTFIGEVRMTRAAELLLYRQRVKTVAIKVGYRPHHFSPLLWEVSGALLRDSARRSARSLAGGHRRGVCPATISHP